MSITRQDQSNAQQINKQDSQTKILNALAEKTFAELKAVHPSITSFKSRETDTLYFGSHGAFVANGVEVTGIRADGTISPKAVRTVFMPPKALSENEASVTTESLPNGLTSVSLRFGSKSKK